MFVSKVSTAFAFAAAVAYAADVAKPAGVAAERNVIAAGGDHDRVYLTVTAPNVVQPAPIVAQPTVVQNAGAAEPTVTVTHTNGAASALGSLGMGAIALVGSVFAASYF
ncbi:hypothetical protein LPJ64_001932 [Coemansia asiatica]|uniref:Uncharacterized protein n=1 Tax=Coemansia asiatica TaxID=1052880 RepID=A0A9W8CLF5_9FUNG|nr:hypothetical protein LPJ64_001932 [Coemansia asiatica]KAJ2878899.1 hypothetical protein FB639_003241 [Coemansia asiatica]